MCRRFLAVFLLLPALLSFWTMPAARATSSGWPLFRLHMVDRATGWGLANTPRGYAILRTTDGGRRWSNVSPGSFWPQPPDVRAINRDFGLVNIDAAFLNGRTGWVALAFTRGDWRRGVVKVERTSDGGRRWRESRFPLPWSEVRIGFTDARHGFLLGISDPASGSTFKAVYRTVDGGCAWTKVSDDFYQRLTKNSLPRPFFVTGLAVRNGPEGWVTGRSGIDLTSYLWRAGDGGRTWRRRLLPFPRGYPPRFDDDDYGSGYSISAYPPLFFGRGRRDGILPVEFRGEKRDGFNIYATRDGGKRWRPTETLALRTLSLGPSYDFVDARHGWLLGLNRDSAARLYRTRDGGRLWTALAPSPRLGTETHGKSSEVQLDFVDPQRGWALVTQTDSWTGAKNIRLLATQDGGTRWQTIAHGSMPPRMRLFLEKRPRVTWKKRSL